MDLGVLKLRCQGADALKQAIHPDNGLAWTDGKGIFLTPVTLFQGQVEQQEHYKLGEFDRGVKSVHWSDNVSESLCYLCVVHDKNISLWRVDGQQPRLTFKQVRKINIQPIPQGCLWSPGRDVLCVLCAQQCSVYHSHLRNKGSQVLLQLDRDKIRCGCWLADGSKLVICVGTTLMVYNWSDIDKSVTQHSTIQWTVPGLLGRISSVAPVSADRLVLVAELPLESLCKQQDTFLIPDLVTPPAGQSLSDPGAGDIIRPSGHRENSVKNTLLNIPRNPGAEIEDCSKLFCVELQGESDPRVVADCQVKGLLTPDILLYEPSLQLAFVGSNTQSLLQAYRLDVDTASKANEIILNKDERPKGIACFPRASSLGYEGVLVLVGKVAVSDVAFPSATNLTAMKSVLKFFNVKQGRHGKAPLTHTTSAPSIPISVATNGNIDSRDYDRLTYSVINFDTNLQSTKSVNGINESSGKENSVLAPSKSTSNVESKPPIVPEPPKRPVRKKKSMRGMQDLSRTSSNSSTGQVDQPKKMAMEYLSDSSETSPRDVLSKQDSLASECSVQSVERVLVQNGKVGDDKSEEIGDFTKSVLKEVDINQNMQRTELSKNTLQQNEVEITEHTIKLPSQNRASSVGKVQEIGETGNVNGELEVVKTDFASEKRSFKTASLSNLCGEDGKQRQAMEDVITKKLGARPVAGQQSGSLESLDDIDRILQAQNAKISQLQEQMNKLSRRVDESSCVLATRYQSISKPDLVFVCFRCKDGFEIKKKFLLDNGRLKLDQVKQAFSLSTLEILIDEDWCVTGSNIDGYIPVRFEANATVYINGNPALS